MLHVCLIFRLFARNLTCVFVLASGSKQIDPINDHRASLNRAHLEGRLMMSYNGQD